MSDTNKRIRVFVGSPGDVAEERDVLSDVIERVNNQLDRDGVGVFLQPIRWEKYDHLRDTRVTPQKAIVDGIPRPRHCDVAVFIFWRRIGTLLDMTGLEPNGAGDRPTGSTWEFYDALESDRTTVLTYRKRSPAPAVPNESSAQFEERQRQEREVHQLFASLRDAEGSFRRYWHDFDHLAEFRADLREQLGIIAKRASRETEAIHDPPTKPETSPAEPTISIPAESDRSITTDHDIGVERPETFGSHPFPQPDLVPVPSRDFRISRHLITFAQYDYFAKETGICLPNDNGWWRTIISFGRKNGQTGIRLPDDRGWGRGDRPVIDVNLDEAKAYAAWLSKQLGQECRLPSGSFDN